MTDTQGTPSTDERPLPDLLGLIHAMKATGWKNAQLCRSCRADGPEGDDAAFLALRHNSLCPVTLVATLHAQAAELAALREQEAKLARLYSALADIYLRGDTSQDAQNRVADAFMAASTVQMTWNSPDGAVVTTLSTAADQGSGGAG